MTPDRPVAFQVTITLHPHPTAFQLSEAGTSMGGNSPSPQISELTSELTDERNTGESASQLLDAETAERIRAEKEMKELQVRAGLGVDSPVPHCCLAPFPKDDYISTTCLP